MDRGVWPATVHGVTKSSDTTDLAGTPWNLFPLILSASASQQSKWVCVWTNSDFCTPGMGSAQGPSSASAEDLPLGGSLHSPTVHRATSHRDV